MLLNSAAVIVIATCSGDHMVNHVSLCMLMLYDGRLAVYYCFTLLAAVINHSAGSTFTVYQNSSSCKTERPHCTYYFNTIVTHIDPSPSFIHSHTWSLPSKLRGMLTQPVGVAPLVVMAFSSSCRPPVWCVCVSVCVCECVYVYVCVCVRVRERERE